MNDSKRDCNRKFFASSRFLINQLCARTQAIVCLAIAVYLAQSIPCTGHEQIGDVVVDTDMALDDARALAVVLTAPELNVKAIVTSDGSVTPLVGATNVFRILHFLGITNIQVGAGRALNKPAPPWAERSSTLGWSELPLPPYTTIADATTVLQHVFEQSTNRVIWLCLGPLSNLRALLEAQPKITNRLSRVYYSGGPPDAPDPGWNTKRDPEAARAVFNSGVEIVCVHLPHEQTLLFDNQLYNKIAEFESPAAKLITRLHAHPNVQALLVANHFRAWDETAALALLQPSIGTLQRVSANPKILLLDNCDITRTRTVYLEALRQHERTGSLHKLVTFRVFPTDPELFKPDLQPFVTEIINRHGLEEWKLVILTSELHGHLGIYSILGAKMALRAREVLGADIDELRVESFAGLKPPLSCLNDGLQVGTGATLGHGTIRVVETTTPEPTAVFFHEDRKLRMSVKEEVLKQVKEAIRAAIAAYGDQTPAYFDQVRRIAVEAWRSLDRTNIFEEVIETSIEPGV